MTVLRTANTLPELNLEKGRKNGQKLQFLLFTAFQLCELMKIGVLFSGKKIVVFGAEE